MEININENETKVKITLNKKEVKSLAGWLNKHKEICGFKNKHGENGISIAAVQTGVAPATVVECSACGKEHNITDYSCW